MSASGKTTIGKKLFERLTLSKEKWVFVDGDTFRNILDEDLSHSIEDRRKNAYRISRFCEYLSLQGVNVLACVLSIFHDNQQYNKENITDYKEVFLDVSLENLLKRDNKKLYKNALNGKIKDVVGVDIKFEPPYAPDLTIDNNIENPNYNTIVDSIVNKFNIKIDNKYIYTQENLLENPQKYQYSKIESELFFKKLKNDRQDSIGFFQKRLVRLNCNNANLKKYNSFYEKDSLILKFFLTNLYLNDNDYLDTHLQTIELLIKRFEVSKKLYLSYDIKEIRKNSSKYHELLNYSLFSLVLQKYYLKTNTEKKFIYLNAVLKLNDIISSIRSDFITASEIFYAKLALESELEIIKEQV